MIILLYGPDDFRREELKKKIIGEFEKKHGRLGMDFFDIEEEGEGERFKEYVRAQSIFEKTKLAVLKNVFSAKGGEDVKKANTLAPLLENIREDKTVTVLLSESAAPPKMLRFLNDDPVKSQKFEHLTGAAWQRFVEDTAKAAGVRLDRGVLELLEKRYENNSWGVVTELQKLAGWGRVITERDAEKISLEATPNYWAVMSGLKSHDRAARLASLQYLLSKNEPAAKIWNMLASQWREKLPAIAKYDILIKSGKLDYEEALTDVAL